MFQIWYVGDISVQLVTVDAPRNVGDGGDGVASNASDSKLIVKDRGSVAHALNSFVFLQVQLAQATRNLNLFSEKIDVIEKPFESASDIVDPVALAFPREVQARGSWSIVSKVLSFGLKILVW